MTDGFVDLGGDTFYRMADVDSMPPFLVSVVSDADHWMYVSSRGGLTCGRESEEHALFPYETDDKLHLAHHHTGPCTLLRLRSGSQVALWEPFCGNIDGRPIRRHLYKAAIGNELAFEETRDDLGLVFRYRWSNSEAFGFVRTATLENTGPSAVTVDVLDGLQNLMPAGADPQLQRGSSCLINAYTRVDVDAATTLATVALSALIVDQAKAVESLKANVLWSTGLDDPRVLLTSDQVPAFRMGADVREELCLRGRRSAYLVSAALRLGAGESREWLIVADVDRAHLEVEAIRALLAGHGGESEMIRRTVREDIARGTDNLLRNVASADGLQLTGDAMATAHHFANVLFNNMRGGVFAHGYTAPAADYAAFVRARNRAAFRRHAAPLGGRTSDVDVREIVAAADATGDPDLRRLAREYLPLTFGRRHGDPSRPWNRFQIKIRNPDGSRALNYQGNWRDIFQNWEALCMSFPEYLENIIAKFLNASTVDGFNPYRVTRDGIDWETPNPDDPWSNIGYWGDHQVVYLLKFLEHMQRIFPGRLEALLNEPIFSYARTPYRIRPYGDLVANPRDTIVFDRVEAGAIDSRLQEVGADARLVELQGKVLHVTLAEKLLVPILAKLSNLVPDGGIWLNTQRPEWNDANNALVGAGVSMVTLCYLRRHIAFCRGLFARSTAAHATVSREVASWLNDISSVLSRHRRVLSEPKVPPAAQREILDALGGAFSTYRETVYASGLSGGTPVPCQDIETLLEVATAYLDHAIHANRREDGLYHAYNLLSLATPGEAQVDRLYAMLEGQVAALSSGLLDAAEAGALLDALFASAMFRADQQSFMLYPERRLPAFLEKNIVTAEEIAGSPLLTKLLETGSREIVARDVRGQVRFSSNFRTTDDVAAALDRLAASGSGGEAVRAERAKVLTLFERTFNLREFTGRSGTMYGYEGLGCIYWHMVSKLLLAVQECAQRARDTGDAVGAARLGGLYYRVRAGLSFNKSARTYGAFPTDPYSHTPGHSGAQQPGMTGQVKEEILTRLGEFGVVLREACVEFDPWLLKRREFLRRCETFTYIDAQGRRRSFTLQENELAFTLCQVPVVYAAAGARGECVRVSLQEGSERTVAGLRLDRQTTRAIFGRQGQIQGIRVELSPDRLME